jgi:hypothetical protein
MSSHEAAARTLTNVDVRVKLSALWIALMFTYTYADVLGFYTPGTLEKLMAGSIGAVQISQGFLVVMALWMAIPSAMIVLSLLLAPGLNRWLNLIVGGLSLLALVATFFTGELSLRYLIQAAAEVLFIAAIIYHAWSWRGS